MTEFSHFHLSNAHCVKVEMKPDDVFYGFMFNSKGLQFDVPPMKLIGKAEVAAFAKASRIYAVDIPEIRITEHTKDETVVLIKNGLVVFPEDWDNE